MRIFRMLPLAVVCLVGCGAPSIVGKWTANINSGSSTLEFTSNTFKQTSEAGKMKMEASGTYTYDGKQITMKITDMNVPDQLKSVIDKVKATPVIIDAKLDGDKLTLTQDAAAGTAASASTGTFTRVK